MTQETFNTKQAIDGQKKYCIKMEFPHFAPTNGRCYSCHNNIYERISAERASTTLITGCPFCHYSYCD